MKNQFSKGYNNFVENSTAQISSAEGSSYIVEVESEISSFAHNMNTVFKDHRTPVAALKGDAAEYWHAGTFNINAKLEGSHFRTHVDRSHNFASADITSNFDKKFGLKYYFSGAASAKEQSKSYFERYMEFTKGGKEISFQDYLTKKGVSEFDVMHDPIYSGQVRIIPSDQLTVAIQFLKQKIEKEQLHRPEQVKRYQDTLNLLQDKIIAPDDIQSISLSEKDARELAQLAKDSSFDPIKHGISTDDLLQFEHVLKQGLKAGASAALITVVLKLVPELYKILNEQFAKGYIDEGALKEIGFKSLSAGTEAYIRGSIAAGLTISCKGGLLGASLKSISPNAIAAITVVCFSTISDSFDLVSGKISHDVLVSNLSRNIFITSCSVGFGVLFQNFIPLPVLGYLLGNFVGSMVGSFAYGAATETAMSFSVRHGVTFFGIVEQNYQLPIEVLKEIGVEIFEYEKMEYKQFSHKEFLHRKFEANQFVSESNLEIRILRRGVIGLRQVGYM